MGCSARSKGESGLAILDFGAPRAWATPGGQTVYGTSLVDPIDAPVAMPTIEALVKSYTDGYVAPTCVPLPGTPVPPDQHMVVAVGMNNDIRSGQSPGLTSDHGAAWGQMINNVQATTTPYRGEINVAAAIDVEPPWSGPTPVVEWINGYSGSTTAHVYNFGSCDGCTPEGAIQNHWTHDDIRYVSYGADRAYPFPQIYFFDNGHSPQPEQWRRISAYAEPYRPIWFQGIMAEDQPAPPASNSPENAWRELLEAIHFDPAHRAGNNQYPYWLNRITQDQP